MKTTVQISQGRLNNWLDSQQLLNSATTVVAQRSSRSPHLGRKKKVKSNLEKGKFPACTGQKENVHVQSLNIYTCSGSENVSYFSVSHHASFNM